MSDITVINDSEQSSLVTNGLAKNGELYLKAAGSTDAGAIVAYDSGVWRTFANEASAGLSNTYSVDLDGSNDSINAVSDPGLSVYTMSFWMKTSQSSFAYIVGGFGGGTGAGDQREYAGIRINTGTGRLLEYQDFNGGGSNRIMAGDLVSGDLNDGAWHHIAIVYVPSGYTTTTGTASGNGEGYKIFLDGTRVDTTLLGSFDLATTVPEFKVGREGARTLYYYNGLIDELAIFGSSLSDSDITAIYNSGVPTDLSSYSPTLWWRMGDNDGGTGTTITDQGSGGTNGTLTNGPTFHDLSTAPDSIYVA